MRRTLTGHLRTPARAAHLAASCARRMQISRTTLSRMWAEARRKVADVLIYGKRLFTAVSPEDSRPGDQEPSAEPTERDERMAVVPGVEGVKRLDVQNDR